MRLAASLLLLRRAMAISLLEIAEAVCGCDECLITPAPLDTNLSIMAYGNGKSQRKLPG